jgi:hypothetical protein
MIIKNDMIINAYITKDNDVYIDGDEKIIFSKIDEVYGVQINNTDEKEIDTIRDICFNIAYQLKLLKEILR